MSSYRRDLLALLALLALTLLFFWKLAFTNLIIARGDIFYYFYPYRDFAAQAVREAPRLSRRLAMGRDGKAVAKRVGVEPMRRT